MCRLTDVYKIGRRAKEKQLCKLPLLKFGFQFSENAFCERLIKCVLLLLDRMQSHI